jgi:hypothetical protein
MADAKGLRRIAEVYALVEQMRSFDLRRTAGAAFEAECAERLEAAEGDEQNGVARAGLMMGDPEQRGVAEVLRTASAVRLERLREVRTVREAERDQAATA